MTPLDPIRIVLLPFPRTLPVLGTQVIASNSGVRGVGALDVRAGVFYGWRIVGGAFVLAVFGWGIGFYGPPIFLSVIAGTRGWSLSLVSGAVTVHFLIGAIVSANLPRLYTRFGTAAVTKAASVCLATGICGWATSSAPWQLFAASLCSGLGWGMMSAAAINGVLSPWFARHRPTALGVAYNGCSAGGLIFSPLWVAGIATLGFPAMATLVAVAMGITMWMIADTLFSRTPQQLGLMPDGDSSGRLRIAAASAVKPLRGAALWQDRKFLTLAAGMALGLFAQIGLTAHLFSLLLPALGAQSAGFAMAAMTAMAIAGRMVVGWAMPFNTDRRLLAALNYVPPLVGSVVCIFAGGANVPLLLMAVLLFGVGFGNSTSLPPLVAQSEFAELDVPRVVALIVGISQAGYAFAPVVFGLVRDFSAPAAEATAGSAGWLFALAALIQGLSIAVFLFGRGWREGCRHSAFINRRNRGARVSADRNGRPAA